jgi:hypothetical protein
MRKTTAVLLVTGLLGSLAALDGVDPAFLRGDADGSGHLSITDPILVLQYAFQGGFSPIGCLDATDADDSGAIDLSDAVLLLEYLFQGGERPAEPFPFWGKDATDDALDCQIAPLPEGGDLIVFCCDRSSSMAGAPWKRLQEEIIKAISEHGPEGLFALVFYDSSLVEFPASGVPAYFTADAKAAAIEFIMSTTTGHGSCMKPALLASLEFGKNSRANSKRIILYSDGWSYCNGMDADTYLKSTLEEVTARNEGIAAIDTVCLGPADGSTNENFMKVLAERNGGEYTRVVQ